MNPNSNSAKFVLILLELIIPLIGFLFWNWDFVFIILFFAIDWLVLILFQFLKMRECLKLGLRKSDKQYMALTILVLLSMFLATVFILTGICYISIPKFNLSAEITRFLSYKDSGIAQGYFLIPLCLLNGYLIYQRDFLKPKIYQIKTIREIFSRTFTIHITIFIVCSIIGSLVYFQHFNEVILLYIALGTIFIGKIYFQLIKPNS